MPTYLERYLAGEYVAVWDELIALGDSVREEPVYSDAYAVALEIMRRVRANVELLIPRLEAIGYRFGGAADEGYRGLILPPVPDATARILEFERTCAPIPLALRACCEIVGQVDFRGQTPAGWTGRHDELVIQGNHALDYFNDWGEYGEEDDLILPIGLFPDIERKRGGPGAGGVEIIVPNGRADAPLVIGDAEDWVYPFGGSLVGYLRAGRAHLYV